MVIRHECSEKHLSIDDAAYHRLAVAIIEQAVTDYCNARSYLRTHKKPRGVRVKGDRRYGDEMRLQSWAKDRATISFDDFSNQ